MNIFFQHLGRRSISNIFATFRRRSRHTLSQYLGGRSVNVHMLAKIPSPALKTPQKWRLKPTEPAPTHAQTSRNHIPHPFGRSRSSLSLAVEEPAAGRRRIFWLTYQYVPTFRLDLRSQHVNILSTFRREAANIQYQHFGGFVSTSLVNLSHVREHVREMSGYRNMSGICPGICPVSGMSG